VNAHEPIITRWLSAGDAGQFEAFDALLKADVIVHAPGGLSTSSCAGEVAVWRAAREAVPDLRHDVQEVLVGDKVEMARVIVSGTIKKDFGGVVARGQRFEVDQAVIVHLQDGLIAEAWEIVDASALSE